jgi:hypothetical protein
MTRSSVRANPVTVGCALALLLAACGGDGNGTAEPSPAAPSPAAEAEPADDGADDDGTASGDVPRPASVTVGSQTWTFAMSFCETDAASSLLVSGSDDAGMLLVVDVSDGSGEVYVSDTTAAEDVVAGTTQDLTMQPDGTFTATGTGSTPDGEQSFTLEGDCDLDQG